MGQPRPFSNLFSYFLSTVLKIRSQLDSTLTFVVEGKEADHCATTTTSAQVQLILPSRSFQSAVTSSVNILDVLRMILDRGCSLDVADVDGDTVLHLAARRGNNELLAALLRKGANPDIKNKV